MARFILDVGNIEDPKEAKKVMERVCDELGDYVARIDVVDLTNTNQLYGQEDLDEGKTNALTSEQILEHSKRCNIV